MCYGLQWVNEHGNREADHKHWKDRFFGGHLLQRIVDVDKVRTLIWCRKCTGWLQLARISEGPYVVGRRVPITQKEFERLCKVYDERTFMAQCGLWHRMEKKILALQNGEGKVHDEISEAKMLHKEDIGAYLLTENAHRGTGNVQSKIKMIEGRQVRQHKEGRKNTEIRVTTDNDEHGVLARVTLQLSDSGERKEFEFEVIQKVARGNQHNDPSCQVGSVRMCTRFGIRRRAKQEEKK